MRHEILLLAIILVLVITEIFIHHNKKGSIVHLAIFLFAIHTAVGFFAIDESSLFGGMFHTNNLIHFFKNVLNVGVLILLLQSADWIQEKIVQQNRGTEFFILLFSSLLGMYFMISSGDFLMFYLGLELSTLPVAALASYETTKRISSEAGIKL
ncbi:MAG: NADH-quinone oxidoreductase subunit N, partial [Flavobacteriaceae bacterium]|nr:NADH-quinone oxidoreductase subunit N [Flavobacteriaceae bacterium]